MVKRIVNTSGFLRLPSVQMPFFCLFPVRRLTHTPNVARQSPPICSSTTYYLLEYSSLGVYYYYYYYYFYYS